MVKQKGSFELPNVKTVMNDEELLRLAEKEILGEAKKASVRYDIAGPSGWKPCPVGKTNKVFLTNTILQAVASNRLRDRKNDEPKKPRRERKFLKSNGVRGPNSNNIIFKKPKVDDKSKPNCEKNKAQLQHI